MNKRKNTEEQKEICLKPNQDDSGLENLKSEDIIRIKDQEFIFKAIKSNKQNICGDEISLKHK